MPVVNHRYTHIDLPTFCPNMPIASNHFEYEAAADDTSALTFLRIARIGINTKNPIKGLGELLVRTDKELNELAELCDARVVDHTWGLYPTQDPPAEHVEWEQYTKASTKLNIPKGYILAAEVEKIIDAKHVHQVPYRPQLGDGLAAYSRSQRAYRLGDPGIQQFVFEGTADNPIERISQPGKPVIVDIEPILA
jgi:hypothetical protein